MNAPLPWPPPTSASDVVDALFTLYADRGATYYDEAVTQTEHALQTAALAEADEAPTELVVAALLHDVGHLLVGEHTGHAGFLADDQRHERIASSVLGRWFPSSVIGPIALHVPAKRYLVATDPGYAASLSTASTRSLAVQGGPMSSAESAAFSRRRYANEACRLRRWDDRAKTEGLRTAPVEHYRDAVRGLVRLEER
ncbi:phosphonate degradation HD-domain oxygenase [Pseudonocardia spinosispora]|uniref:phosphonate degradation HD-domain oxygenase n=1 Tax=Pseudonocardia spinosispora TaxID=103441 RepID=UPI0003FB3032|nr:phosphonate degradation HD-domain oxygenase [Pseudonocardia spinosispora]